MPLDILIDSQRAFYLAHSKSAVMIYGMRVFKEWVIEEMQNDTDRPKKSRRKKKDSIKGQEIIF